MAKEKHAQAPATFINADKTLIQIEGIVNVQKIYFDMKNHVGTPKDSLESALRNKGFVVEVREDKKADIRGINTSIYFAEMDLAKEEKNRLELRKALKGGDAKDVEEKKIRYGLAVFLNREQITSSRFEDELAHRFEFYSKKNVERPDDVGFYKKQVESESDAFQKTYNMLEKAGIAKKSDRGTMYLENFNTFKKVELIKVIDSPYSNIDESLLQKAMSIAVEKKAISDEAYKNKTPDAKEDVAKEDVAKEDVAKEDVAKNVPASQEEKPQKEKTAKRSKSTK